MDRIHVRDLELWCIVGVNPDEREKQQKVVLNLVLECDLAPAGRSDCLEDTPNYRTIKEQVVDAVCASRYFLLEKMAQEVAGICLGHDGVQAVTVTVDKPGALRRARSVAVEIRRERGG